MLRETLKFPSITFLQPESQATDGELSIHLSRCFKSDVGDISCRKSQKKNEKSLKGEQNRSPLNFLRRGKQNLSLRKELDPCGKGLDL